MAAGRQSGGDRGAAGRDDRRQRGVKSQEANLRTTARESKPSNTLKQARSTHAQETYTHDGHADTAKDAHADDARACLPHPLFAGSSLACTSDSSGETRPTPKGLSINDMQWGASS
eukprot:4395876-Pyramimonas_sp.AAC.1